MSLHTRRALSTLALTHGVGAAAKLLHQSAVACADEDKTLLADAMARLAYVTASDRVSGHVARVLEASAEEQQLHEALSERRRTLSKDGPGKMEGALNFVSQFRDIIEWGTAPLPLELEKDSDSYKVLLEAGQTSMAKAGDAMKAALEGGKVEWCQFAPGKLPEALSLYSNRYAALTSLNQLAALLADVEEHEKSLQEAERRTQEAVEELSCAWDPLLSPLSDKVHSYLREWARSQLQPSETAERLVSA